MAFSQGISGLGVAAANLDVIGNNIANSGTVGYKSAAATFQDVYAGSRVGLGASVSGVVQNFTQGVTQTSSRPLDVAILNGDGFYRLTMKTTKDYGGRDCTDDDSNNTGQESTNYVFFDPLFDEKKERHEQTIELGEDKTDSGGQTEFDLQLERFADATYSMRFVAEGFEAEGGRSVTGTLDALVSALPYVIGCKPDGDLRYIEMDKPRTVDLIAVDPQLNRIALANVTANVISQEQVSVLTKQENGNFAYESVLKERVAKSEKISVSANGLHYTLPTDEPGNYVFELRDDQDRRHRDDKRGDEHRDISHTVGQAAAGSAEKIETGQKN